MQIFYFSEAIFGQFSDKLKKILSGFTASVFETIFWLGLRLKTQHTSKMRFYLPNLRMSSLILYRNPFASYGDNIILKVTIVRFTDLKEFLLSDLAAASFIRKTSFPAGDEKSYSSFGNKSFEKK